APTPAPDAPKPAPTAERAPKKEETSKAIAERGPQSPSTFRTPAWLVLGRRHAGRGRHDRRPLFHDLFGRRVGAAAGGDLEVGVALDAHLVDVETFELDLFRDAVTLHELA